jgi:hypothetical protein
MGEAIKYKELIRLFIDLSEFEISWGKEFAIAKRLLSQYPDISFWRFIHKNTSLTLKLPSLAWFMTEKGKKCLVQQYKKFKVDFSAQKSYNIGNEVVVPINKNDKISNLVDFTI